MLRKTLQATYLGLATCGVGFGQVTLENKFHEGANYAVESTVKTSQKLNIAGMDVETNSDTKSTSKMSVGKRDVEGKLRVEQRIESLQIAIGVMGQNYDFDSANPDNKGTSLLEFIRDVHKALLKQVTTVVYDKSNKAVAVEFDRDIAGSVPQEIQGLVKSQLDPTNLKNQANDQLEQIKSDPISKGDTWQRTSSTNFGAGQIMDFKTDYTYEGTVEKDGKTLDKITSKVTSVNYALDNSPLPLALKASDLKAEESQGTVLFDRTQGQIVQSSSSMRITGDITFTVNNMDVPAKIDLKIETSMAVKP